MHPLTTAVNCVAPHQLVIACPIGVSAQTAAKTLSGWSGAWR
ncbi:hypothetical protein [Lapidilactobacillus salsurivasis]